MKSLFLVVLLVFTLTGCATLERGETVDTEQLLAAAGFKMKLADTPEKLAHLQTLTQHKIVAHQKEVGVGYVYADAATCQCLYVGNEKAYQHYQRLAVEKKIAEDKRMAAEMNRDAAMNWNMWGPWVPWW
jgi:hypothetical protein